MKFHPVYNSRGVVLASVVCTIMILGGVGAVLICMASARFAGVDSLERRLESSRISAAFADSMKDSLLESVRNESTSVTYHAFPFTGTNVNVQGSTVTEGFPADVLSRPRSTPDRGEQDPGSPADMVWRLRYSEAIRGRGVVSIEKFSFGKDVSSFRSISSEATVWRIPAAAFRFTSSRLPLTLSGLTINAVGPAALMGTSTPSGLTAHFIAVDGGGDSITAGNDPASRFSQIYDNPALPGSVTIQIDSLTALPGGFSVVDYGGKKYPALNLREFFGPRSISVTGSAVSDGLCIIGSNVPGTPISVAVSGPVFALGSNARYAILATNSRLFGFCSRVVYDSATDEWLVPAGAASDQIWHGHFFIGQSDPSIRLEETWSGRHLTISGSLHVIGGTFSTYGAGAGTFSQLNLSEPDWENTPNPFTFGYRHESLLATFR